MVLCSHRTLRFLNDNDDDNGNKGGSDAAFFVSECTLRKRQLAVNLSINCLFINTKAYSPFGSCYSLQSCSRKASKKGRN